MKEIKLTQDKVALVDDEDYEYLNQWKWYAWSSRGIYYASRSIRVNGKKSFIHMHREVISTNKNLKTDHIDGNGLNNQKYNLRQCSHSENMCNRKPSGQSKYLGVSYNIKRQKYRSQIKINGEVTHLGSFDNEIDAALTYNEAAKKYHGEFANLNIIEG